MSDAGSPGPLNGGDLAALAAMARGNEWTRSVLCTLARRGVALRQREPARADALVVAVSAWPWFKAGQLLFDLMEWEDFMVDGEPPPVIPTVLDAVAAARFSKLLDQLRGLLDGAAAGPVAPVQHAEVEPGEAGGGGVGGAEGAEDLPELEQGFHLYRDVVLGVFTAISPLLEEGR